MIDRPIFVIGCGRSGSTLLYNMLCTHADLGWFSNFTDKFPRWLFLARLSKLYPLRLRYTLPRIIAKAIPKPSEGYNLWDLARPVQNSPSDPPLSFQDAHPIDKTRIESIIQKHMQYQPAVRFINKNTRNTRRIGYLDALFPDARFIHILRDPRASVASLLKVEWWPELEIWNQNLVTPLRWAAQGNDPVRLAAELWRDETQMVLEYKHQLESRYLMIHYEDLIAQPEKTLRPVVDFCDLDWTEYFAKQIEYFNIMNMNYKYQVDLLPEQQDAVKKITSPTLESLGIEYN